MPQFRKIDGLLSNEMQGSVNDLESAIAAINEAVDQNAADNVIVGTMENPAAQLSSVHSIHAEKYKMVMRAEKRQKADQQGLGNENVQLKHDEIQELVDSMNRLMTLQIVEDMVRSKDKCGLIEAIAALKLDTVPAVRSNLVNDALMAELTSILQRNDLLRLQDIEKAFKIASGKIEATKRFSEDNISSVVRRINQSLENGNIAELLVLLKSPCLDISDQIHLFAGSLYFAELDYIRRGSGTDLRADGIIRVCKFLCTVAEINEAAQKKNYEELFYLATKEGSNLEDLQESLKNRYGEAMHTALATKQKLSMTNLKRPDSEIGCKLLNHADIQDCIDMVNSEEVDYEKVEAVRLVNSAVQALDHVQLFKALLNPHLELQRNLELRKNEINLDVENDSKSQDPKENGEIICEEDSLHYLCLLRDIQRNRGQLANKQVHDTRETTDSKSCELWMEDILEAIENGLKNVQKAKAVTFNLSILNMAVLQQDIEHVYEILSCEVLDLIQAEVTISKNKKSEYAKELYKIINSKEESGASGSWVEHKLMNTDGSVTIAYLDLKEQKHAWRKPRDYHGPRLSAYLGQEDLLSILKRVNSIWTRGSSLPSNFDLRIWTQFQARCRGNLVRRNMFTMLRHYYDNEQKIMKIQAYWKGKVQRKKYLQMLQDHKVRFNYIC